MGHNRFKKKKRQESGEIKNAVILVLALLSLLEQNKWFYAFKKTNDRLLNLKNDSEQRFQFIMFKKIFV